MEIKVTKSADQLTPEDLEKMRKVQAKEEERQTQVRKLLERRRLLKHELRQFEDAMNLVREQLPRAVAHDQADRVVELRNELETKQAKQAELNSAVDAIDRELSKLLPNQQFGRHMVAAFSWDRDQH